MRLLVRSGVRMKLSLRFSRTVESAPDTPKVGCFPGHWTLSPGNLISGCQAVKKKRQLFPGLPQVSLSSLTLPYYIHCPVGEY